MIRNEEDAMTLFHRYLQEGSTRSAGLRILAFTALAIAFSMALLSPLRATQRMVLAENYTNSG
jgi:hypothetical protein